MKPTLEQISLRLDTIRYQMMSSPPKAIMLELKREEDLLMRALGQLLDVFNDEQPNLNNE